MTCGQIDVNNNTSRKYRTGQIPRPKSHRTLHICTSYLESDMQSQEPSPWAPSQKLLSDWQLRTEVAAANCYRRTDHCAHPCTGPLLTWLILERPIPPQKLVFLLAPASTRLESGGGSSVHKKGTCHNDMSSGHVSSKTFVRCTLDEISSTAFSLSSLFLSLSQVRSIGGHSSGTNVGPRKSLKS